MVLVDRFLLAVVAALLLPPLLLPLFIPSPLLSLLMLAFIFVKFMPNGLEAKIVAGVVVEVDEGCGGPRSGDPGSRLDNKAVGSDVIRAADQITRIIILA